MKQRVSTASPRSNKMGIGHIAMAILMSCSTQMAVAKNITTETTSREPPSLAEVGSNDPLDKESARVVKVLRRTESKYYDEEGIYGSEESFAMERGYYHYESETDEYYLVCLGQDGPYTIPKKDAKIEVWTAAQGHGFVQLYSANEEAVVIKAKPSDNAKTIASIPYEEYGMPDDVICKGVKGEWFKVKYGKKKAYIRRNNAVWCINVVDACGEIR